MEDLQQCTEVTSKCSITNLGQFSLKGISENVEIFQVLALRFVERTFSQPQTTNIVDPKVSGQLLVNRVSQINTDSVGMKKALRDLEKRMETLNRSSRDMEKRIVGLREEAAEETNNPTIILLAKELNSMKGKVK